MGIRSSKQAVATQAARRLIGATAIHFAAAEPFTFSGLSVRSTPTCARPSPFREMRTRLVDFAVETIDAALDVVAGGEAAGMPLAAWIQIDLSYTTDMVSS